MDIAVFRQMVFKTTKGVLGRDLVPEMQLILQGLR